MNVHMPGTNWRTWAPAPYIRDDPEDLFVRGYAPHVRRNLATATANERVREMYYLHMLDRLGTERDSAKAWERERTLFAKDWVALVEANPDSGLVMPGGRPNVVGRTPEEARKAHVDAARTPQRTLKVGDRLATWQLVGIECTICQRKGYAMPHDFYVSQGVLL